MGKRERPFNNPFGRLTLPKPAQPSKRTAKKEARFSAPVEDEAALFREMVGQVEPVRGKPITAAPRPPPTVDLTKIADPELDVLIQLSELVTGFAPFDIADADEYIEGYIHGLDAKILRRLRAGDYAIQGHVDLHGLTRVEAKKELERFIDDARKQSKRCVLVVHGRGLHSKDQIPVLKESVQVWLGHGRISKYVLAFASARPHDGGVGAVYVLLRRR